MSVGVGVGPFDVAAAKTYPVLGATSGSDFATWTYGQAPPAWVKTLMTARGVLPSVALDLKHGRGWVQKALLASGIGSLLTQNPAWGTFDPSSIVNGSGLGADFHGANNAQPTLAQSVSSKLLRGFTALQVLTGSTPPSAGTCSTQVYLTELPDFGCEFVSQLSVEFLGSTSASTSVSLSDQNGEPFQENDEPSPPTIAGTYGLAATHLPGTGMRWAWGGVAKPPINEPVQPSITPTDISIAVVSELDSLAAHAAFGYLELLVFWGVQPDADLPGISNMRTPA